MYRAEIEQVQRMIENKVNTERDKLYLTIKEIFASEIKELQAQIDILKKRLDAKEKEVQSQYETRDSKKAKTK